MPEFAPGSVHSATATFSNPKSAGFDFDASLCMGADWTEMATASFHLDAGQSKPVQFSITMPSTLGTYPVYFKVYSGGMLIGTFVADEDVVIAPVALLLNPSFEAGWTGWTFYSSNPGRFGCSIDSKYEAYEGLYSARFFGSSPSGVIATLSQVVPWRDDYRGKTFNLSVMRKVLILGSAHDINGLLAVIIDDGVGAPSEIEVYFSEAAWVKQEVIRAISPNATKLEVIFRITPNRNWRGSGFHIDKAILEKV